MRPLPVAAACHLGGLLGRIAWHFAPARRALVVRNLRIAFGREAQLADLQTLARRVFARCGSNLIAAVKTATMPPAKIAATVAIEGHQHLQAAIATHKGVIFLLPHQGNWELLAQLGPIIVPGLHAAAMYRPLSNPLLDSLVRRRRERLGTRLVSNREGPGEVIAHLREGGAVGLLADQQAGYHGAPAVFFTRLASLTPLPLILARRTGAAVVPLALRQDRAGHWTIRLFAPLQVGAAGDPAPMARAYESIIRWAAVDYFWLQDPWKVSRRAPLRFVRAPGKLPTPPLPGSFPVLAHLPAHLAPLATALAAARPDIALTVLVGGQDDEPTATPAGTTVLRYQGTWNERQLAAALRAHEDQLSAPFEVALLLAGDRTVAGAAARAHLRHRIGTAAVADQVDLCIPTDDVATVLERLKLAQPAPGAGASGLAVLPSIGDAGAPAE